METPNPNSVKFFPGDGVQVLDCGTYDFPNSQSTHCSPLAKYSSFLLSTYLLLYFVVVIFMNVDEMLADVFCVGFYYYYQYSNQYLFRFLQ